MQIFKKILISFIGVILVLFIVGFFLPSDKKQVSPTEVSNDDHASIAYMTSQNYVKQEVSTPEGVTFDAVPKYCKNEGNNNYRIVSYVTLPITGQRLMYKCVLHYKGSDDLEDANWEVISPVELSQ